MEQEIKRLIEPQVQAFAALKKSNDAKIEALKDGKAVADLDAKLKEAGILPGHSSADDVLARLTQAEVTVVTPRIGQSTPGEKEPG